MVGESRNKKNVSIFVLVGVSHRLTQSTKVYVDREGETSTLKKWNVGRGGDSRIMQLPSKARSKKFQMSLCDVECCWRHGHVLSGEHPGDFLDFGPERGSAKGTMADLRPLGS